MKKGKILKVFTPEGEYNVRVKRSSYVSNGSLAVCLYYEDCGEWLPLCAITVNLEGYDEGRKSIDKMFNEVYPQPRYACQFVDINNCMWAEEFILASEIGIRTWAYGYSGYCSYPLYAFDLNKLAELEREA